MRQLEKNIKKEMKVLKKVAEKSKNKGNIKPSGFANPTKVTKALCNKKKHPTTNNSDIINIIIRFNNLFLCHILKQYIIISLLT